MCFEHINAKTKNRSVHGHLIQDTDKTIDYANLVTLHITASEGQSEIVLKRV